MQDDKGEVGGIMLVGKRMRKGRETSDPRHALRIWRGRSGTHQGGRCAGIHSSRRLRWSSWVWWSGTRQADSLRGVETKRHAARHGEIMCQCRMRDMIPFVLAGGEAILHFPGNSHPTSATAHASNHSLPRTWILRGSGQSFECLEPPRSSMMQPLEPCFCCKRNC